MSASKPTPICVIYGANAFQRRQELGRVTRNELAGGDPALNLSAVDGANASIGEVLDDVRTLSMLGGRRVVVVDEADAFISQHRAALEHFVAHPCDSGCLVLICNTFPSNHRLYKAVRASGQLVECKAISGHALKAWLTSTAQAAYGKRINPQAAACLIEHVGESQETLNTELSKLSMYVGSRPEITAGDIEAAVGQYREQNVFAVMGAISSGDAKTALHEWQQVWATDRAAPGRALGGLAWGVRKLMEARRDLDRGASLESLARKNWTDAAVFRRRMKRLTVRGLQDQLVGLMQADYQTKKGLSTVATGIEKFIVRHSTGVQG